MRHVLPGQLVVALIALLFAPWVSAQDLPPLRAEIDYRLIRAQPVSVAGGIEVIDFFWYGCPHCNNLQPALEQWIHRKPADVTVRRIPAILRDSWAPHARIYYTLAELGEAERLHLQVYRSYHVEKLHMSKPEVMSDWAVHHGIDRDRWNAAYTSEAVASKVAQAAQLTRNYGIEGTPSLVINGHFLTSGNMAATIEDLVSLLDRLVRLARSQATSQPSAR